MMPVTVGNKLGAGFVVVVLLFLLISVNTWHRSVQVGMSIDTLFERGVVDTGQIAECQVLLQRMRMLVFQHMTADRARKLILEQQMDELNTDIDKKFDEIGNAVERPVERAAKLQAARKAWEIYDEFRESEVLPISRAGEKTEAYELSLDRGALLFEDAFQAVSELLATHIAHTEEIRDEAVDVLDEAIWVSAVGGMIGALLAVLIAIWLSRDVSWRLGLLADAARSVAQGGSHKLAAVQGADEIGALSQALQDMARQLDQRIEHERQHAEALNATLGRYGAFVARLGAGDLAARLEHDPDGDLGRFGRHLDEMGQALRRMTLRIHESVRKLSDSTAEILATTEQHVASATETASAVTQTVATTEELRQIAIVTARQFREVAGAARQGVSAANDGQKAVGQTVTAMREARKEMETLSARILAMAGQSQAIEAIIDSVNELAERTNILAVNAAIEAARAGDHGRGFAVVAQEVGSLAEQSKRATMSVRSLLGEVQRSTAGAVILAEDSGKAVSRAADVIAGAGSSIDALAQTVASNATTAQQVLDAVEQQAAATAQISEAMGSIRAASQLSVDGSRTNQQAAKDLSALAVRLREAADFYRV